MTTSRSGMTEPDFDVIVVGAGIAGTVAARELAVAGHSVLVLERGAVAGAKNLSGGLLYCREFLDIFPDFAVAAPVERVVVRHRMEYLGDADAVALDYGSGGPADPPNAVSVLRARLDPWLVAQCEAAGATVLMGVRVDGLLVESGRVVGVRAGGEVLRSRVVVAADGVNSFLAEEAGLLPRREPGRLGLGVKCVVGLGSERIEDRFQCGPGEGAAHTVVGDFTGGIRGAGFLYTNRESVSAGIVLRLDDLAASTLSSTQVLDGFLGHPSIARLLAGGELLEYGAHLVPEGGPPEFGRLVHDGLLLVGDAAGLTLNSGLTLRGMDLAAASAVSAARTISAALLAQDTSRQGLLPYLGHLADSDAGRDLKTFAQSPRVLENRRFYADYGRAVADVLGEVHRREGPKRPLRRVLAGVRGRVRLRDLLRDAWAVWRSL